MKKWMRILFKSKKAKIAAAVVLIAAVSAGAVFYIRYQNAKPAEVSLCTASKGPLAQHVTVTGDIEASSRSKLYLSPTVKVTQVLVSEGQAVKKGDVLATLDTSDYEAQLQKQRINLALAQTTLNYLSGVGAKLDQSTADNAVQQAELALQARQSDYDAAAAGLDRTNTLNLSQISNAEAALQSANANYDAAADHLETVRKLQENLVSQAQAALDGASDDYDAAESNLSSVKKLTNNLIDQADAACDIAETNYDYALAAMEDIKVLYDSDPAAYAEQYASAAMALSQAAYAYNSAQAALANAKLTANAQIEAAEQAVNGCETAVQAAQTALSSAQLTADAEIKAAEKAANDCSSAVQTAQTALSDAQVTTDAAAKTAEKAVADCETAVRSAEVALAGAKTAASYTGSVSREQITGQQAQIDLCKADISYLSAKLEECSLKANVDGVVTRMDAVAGQYPESGDAIIVDGMSEYLVSLDVSQQDSVKVRTGQQVSVTVKGIAHTYGGVISQVGLTAEKSLTSADQDPKITVKVTITDPDENIKAGYEADAEISLSEKTDALQVRYEAVRVDGGTGKTYVYVVNGDGKAEKRYVEIGLETDVSTEILSGLTEGEQCIVNPGQEITDGVSVSGSVEQ